ncbi:MAG: nicotinamide riboside transporter PnuC [Myroides sp.]|nr:nicotinamide riboside transporter PnuC [Myroides sp.]
MMQEILSKTTWIEWFGVFFSVIQVLLAQRNNINNYLFGIAGIVLAMYVKFHAKLYAEFALDFYYLIMSVYGWIFWKYGKQQSETPISFSTKNEWLKAVIIVGVAFTLFFVFLTGFTDSDVPFLDSIVTAFAWAGMWLMAKRKIENWIFLNISNFIAVPLLIHKELYLFAGLTAFLFIVAIFGYKNWYRLIKNQQNG